jgi:DNA-binding IclR family transcriptional regulator
MVSKSESRYGIAAVDRTVAILVALELEGALRLTDVAHATGLSEPTAFRYLSTLVEHRMVDREPDGTYRLGLRLFAMGQRAVGQRDVRKVALSHMERLLERFEETVNLAVRRGDELVLIEVLESQRSIRKGASIGDTDVWHCSGLGKAIMALLPEKEVREILARRGTPALTDRTLCSVDDVVNHLAVVRERGYAVDDEEAEPGLRCVAAAVKDRRGTPLYALSVSGPAGRIEPDATAEIGREIAAAARAISEALGFDGNRAGMAANT